MTEIDKSTTIEVTATKTINVKWILEDTEPTAPAGYTRMSEFDIDLGALGKLWAFKGST